MVVVGVTTVVGVIVLVEIVSTTTTDCVTDTTVATVTVLTGVGSPKHEQALEMSEQACGKPKQFSPCDVVFEMIVAFEGVIIFEVVGDILLFVG